MSDNKQQKINQQLLEELNSKDSSTALEAVAKIRSQASAEIIPDLLEKWFSSEGKLQEDLTELLYTLKDSEVIEPLLDALDEDRFQANRDKIISIFWNTGMHPVDHLSTFVHIALNGTYMEALECLTLIENVEDPFPEEEIMDSLLMLKDYFAEEASKTDEKRELIRTIATILQYKDETQ